MLRCSPALLLALAPALFSACSSEGSGGVGSGGSGGLGSSSGATTGGQPGESGGTSGRGAGGASANGGAASGGSGERSAGTGGAPSNGGRNGAGAGGRSAAGGTTANGGSDAGSAGGAASSGGTPASGGRNAGGMPGMAGAQNAGGATAGMASAGGAGGAPAATECPSATWKLAWGDDFDGASGTAVDSSKWAYDSGPNWYNGELQDYTTGTTNASLDGNGNLVIEARKEAREGRQYTSARLKTEGKKTFTYGRFEGRMKVPYGQGMWPAFWMLGGNSWPNTGEIDIMENLGREPSIAHGTIHGPGYSGSAGPTATYTLPGGAKFADDFHVFAVEWEADAIRWYVDGELYSTKTPTDIGGNKWVFDHGFFFIVNLAVGGDWPGAPDDTTVFPQRFVIDYIRVCEK